jgi:ribonuclease BN (tRNA processing enzyme)
MHPTEHPGGALAYRFDCGHSGKSFAFLTDEEVRKKIPASFKKFLHKLDLVIQDAQYNEETYQSRTKGYGHGTPDYAVDLAVRCGIKRVGLTHHDPLSTDGDIEKLRDEAIKVAEGRGVSIFACADYQEIEL